MTTQKSQRDYILGHEEEELQRLMKQALALAPMSEHLLQLAGIEAGMQVLDLGCGPGDVTFLAARLVGAHGKVIGIDASPEVVALAKRRAEHLGIENVHFIARDLNELTASDLGREPGAAGLDALIGRLVLMYLPDASAVLKRLISLLRPGGIVTFQEFDAAGIGSEPHCELFERTAAQIKAAFAHKKLDLRLGPKLPRIFAAAGLSGTEMRLEGRIESGSDAMVYEALTSVMRTLLPLLIGAEIATAEEIGIDTLASRLRDEAAACNATLKYVPLVGAWAQTDRGQKR
ncbi:MAG TPA: class I SAM-dependent methyltransferase [Polyangiales bacterium]|nr:class I SAM-dependent methyltransferase [Polyangiales bacterium]